MSARGHDRHGPDAGAYVLGALPELEQQAFERHVMGCGECRDAVERLQLAADALPLAATQLDAPPALRTALLALVESDLEAARGGAAASSGPGRLGALVESARQVLRRARPAGAWVSAVFLLAAGVLAGWGAQSVLSDPDERTIAATVDKSELVQGSGSLLIPEHGDRAILSVHGLPELPSEGENAIYQLWLVRGAERIPSSVFSVGEDGSGTAVIASGIDAADAVWVTREPPGGSRAPTEAAVMQIDL